MMCMYDYIDALCRRFRISLQSIRKFFVVFINIHQTTCIVFHGICLSSIIYMKI